MSLLKPPEIKVHVPIMYKLVNSGFTNFARVMRLFRTYDLDKGQRFEDAKQDALLFLIIESNCWDVYSDSTSGMLFESIKQRMKSNGVMLLDTVCERLANNGMHSQESVEQQRIKALMMIKYALLPYQLHED